MIIKSVKNNSDVINNSIWLFLDYSLKFVGGYFVAIWLAREVGPSDFGFYNYVLSYIFILSNLSSAGLNGIAVKEFIQHKDRSGQILGTIFMIKTFFSIICFIGFLLFFLQYESSEFLLALFIGLKLIFKGFNVIELFFESRIQSNIKVIARGIAYLVRVLLIVFFILKKLNIEVLGVILLIEEAISAILLLYFYNQRSGISIRNWSISKSQITRLLGQSWPLIISSIGAILYIRIDQIMIVEMLGDQSGGYYASAVKLTELFFFIPTILITSFNPKLIALHKTNNKLYRTRVKKLISLFIYVAITISVLMTFLSYDIIYYSFGISYLSAVPILKIYIWTLVLVFLGRILSRWLIIENLTKFSLLRHSFGLVVNLVLNFLLIPIYGEIGAAVASLFALLSAVIIFAFFNHKTFSFLKLIFHSLIFRYT